MKKLLVITFALMMVLSLTGCKKAKKSGDVTIVCSTFPIYDWVSNMTDGIDGVDVVLLMKSGSDLHSFSPSAKDILTIGQSDVFIYVGGESDDWVNDAISQSSNKNLKSLSLMELMGDKARVEEFKEGMQKEADEEEEEEEEVEYDEHVWLSLKNAQYLCDCIKSELDGKLSDNDKEKLSENSKNYIDKLSALDKEYEKAVSEAKNNTIVVCDRFPFVYLISDYKLDYYAAFVGCSAESEASFETISFLSDKVKSLKLDYVFKIDKSDGKIASTVLENSGRKNGVILELNSLQSVSENDAKKGVTYLKVMEENLATLKKALN